MKLGFIDKRILIALVLILFCVDYLWDPTSYIPADRLHGIIEKAGHLAPILYMTVMALAVVIPFIPTLPLDIAAGALFGPFLGTIYSAVGATAGAAVAFLIARNLGREFMERFLFGHVNFCTQCSDRLLTKVVAISRLLPFVSFKVVSYGAGLTMMSLGAFSLATFLGMLPITFAYNYFRSAILATSRGTILILGLLLVSFLFWFPHLVERYNLFSLRTLLEHGKKSPSSESKGHLSFNKASLG